MILSKRKYPLQQKNHLSVNGCISYALKKIGKTREQILKEIKKDKEIESKVLNMYQEGFSMYQIAKKINLKLSEVKWIITSDFYNLSYRKIAEKYGEK